MRWKSNFLSVTAVIMIILFISGCGMNQQPAEVQKTVITIGGSVSNAPYSPGVMVGNTLYVSGRLGTDPSTGELGNDISEQTKLALESIRTVLREAGLDMKDVVKSTVYLKNLEDYAAMNAAYAPFFPSEPPARATVQAGLVLDALIEISCIAVKTN